MANHVIAISIDVLMEEMDGDPNESAEVFLDRYSERFTKWLRDNDFEYRFRIEDAWEGELSS